MVLDATRVPMRMSAAPDAGRLMAGMQGGPDANAEKLAFLTVRELAELVRTKRVSSVTLTRMYLARLKRLDAKLKFVITLTEERALGAGGGDGCGTGGGQIPGAAAWDSMGGEGFAGGEGVSDDVGCGGV